MLFVLLEAFEVDNGFLLDQFFEFSLPLHNLRRLLDALLDPLQLEFAFVFEHQIELRGRIIVL